MDETTPFNVSTALVKKLATPIGYIFKNWCLTEQALVGQIEAVSAEAEKAGLKLVRQSAFSDRIDLMRRIFSRTPSLSPYTEKGILLLDKGARTRSVRIVR